MSELQKYSNDVKLIKNAILQSRYRAAQSSNKEQLLLYYSIGHYVSQNTRTGKWGTGAIEEISRQLQLELPGLRGYSASSIKYMRTFFEEWVEVFSSSQKFLAYNFDSAINDPIRHLLSDELQNHDDNPNRHLPSGDLESTTIDAFLRIGFTHHREILSKCKLAEERWYYIMRCASEFWSVESLKDHIKADDYSRTGALPNNFELTIPDEKLAARAVRSFKDEHVKKPHENNSIGLLLCKDTKKSIVELAIRDFNKPMGVATYSTMGNIPKEYQSLKPLIDGVQEILSASET